MTINSILRKINNKLANHTTRFYELGYAKQKEYLDSFPNPVNDIQRSFYQYRCQVYSCENQYSFLLKIIGSTFLYLIKMVKMRAEMNTPLPISAPVVYLSVNHKSDMLPWEITSKGYEYVPYDNSFFMDEEDKLFMQKVKMAYPHSYYFLYKVLLKIGFYSYVIKKYSPKEIIVHGETSFTSSILTQYCESHGIKHIDVMHGEKVFLIRDAFFRFTECYVWSDYHVDLFTQMRADKSLYKISLPPSMVIDKKKIMVSKGNRCDYKFYLAYETNDTIKKIRYVVDLLEKHGRTVMLRPHPFYTDMALLRRSFDENSIEIPQKVGIEQSIISTKNVVSVFSTVMRQAIYAGINVIVDDISNPAHYNGMKDLKFWLYETNHRLLSDEIAELS